MHYIRHMSNATSKSNVEPIQVEDSTISVADSTKSYSTSETVEFSWFRRPISKQLPLELN